MCCIKFVPSLRELVLHDVAKIFEVVERLAQDGKDADIV